MKFVSSIDDIKKNLRRLASYRDSVNGALWDFYCSRIKLGICFVVTKTPDGKFWFGPSRFVGYKNNDMIKHMDNSSKHGSLTNKVIENISGKVFKANKNLEKQYIKLCREEGIEPRINGTFEFPRKFMVI